MSDNLHRKLFEKLQHGQDEMPDYSLDEWLQLDKRLDLYEERRNRRVLLLWSIPLLMLLGINGLLGWKLWNHTHNQNGELATVNRTVVYDTIYNKVVIHQYDTVYHTIFRNNFRNGPGLAPAYDEQIAGNSGDENGAASSPSSIAEANNPLSKGIQNETGGQEGLSQNRIMALIPYLATSLLKYPEKHWYDLFREISVRPATPRRVAFLRQGHFTLGAGPVISWKDGLSSSNGISIAIGNEVGLGSDRLSWWQELSWSELKLKAERAIDGFPHPPSPDPNAKLDKNIFSRRDLGLHTGLGYAFPVKKKFEVGLRLGIGSNYRLGGRYLLDYEDHDTDTHYEITENVSSGWDGLNASAGLGFSWQASRNWQLQLQSNYYHYLSAGLEDWRIPNWATLRLGVNYRWR
ncbi:MAG: hypothetical protein Kow0027_25370 [Saprospiraceae bacterium]